MSYPRPLTEKERNWLKQAIMERGYLGSKITPKLIDPTPYLNQIDSLQVWGRCSCGDPTCETVYFTPERHLNYVLVHTNTKDGRELIVTVDENNKIVELEII